MNFRKKRSRLFDNVAAIKSVSLSLKEPHEPRLYPIAQDIGNP
jgi:hypothetical protein